MIKLSRWLILWIVLLGGVGLNAETVHGLSVGGDGQLLLDGRAYQAIGVNYYDLFLRQLVDSTNRTGHAGLTILARYQIPFVRFSAGGYWPRDWRLYQTNRADYFSRLDSVVRSAEQLHIGLIPSLFWYYSTIPDLAGEPVSSWGGTNSRTHELMREYTREVLVRYARSSAIWAWEFGNEYNLPADLPNAAEHRAPVVAELGTPSSRSAADDLTHDMVRVALTQFAVEVRRHDSNRLILSGNAFPRVSAWHQIAVRNWQRDTPEQFFEVIDADNPSLINSLCVRAYDFATDLGRLPLAMRASRTLKKPLVVGEFGVPGPTTEQTKTSFVTLLRAMETNQVPLAALWVYDFDSQSRDWNVTASNGRVWQLEAIRAANVRLNGTRSNPR